MNSITKKEYAALVFADDFKTIEATGESAAIRELQSQFVSSKYDKFLFSDSSVVRAMNMNIDKISSKDLMNLYFKTGKECGVVMLSTKYEKINFMYAITPTQITLGVFIGSPIDIKYTDDNLFSKLNDIHIGDITVNDSGITYSPNTILSIMIESYNIKDDDRLVFLSKDPFLSKQMALAYKELMTLDKPFFDDPIKTPFLYNENAKNKKLQVKLEIAIKCFLFLKLANITNKTFISGKSTMTTYKRLKKEKNIDYIYIDGHYDQNISITGPFNVSGHFRNQPKKNENGEWYTELIYIDSFMKKGYTRKATKLKLEE